jgi:hypothetical protein
VPIIPVTREAKAGELLESRNVEHPSEETSQFLQQQNTARDGDVAQW